MWHCDIHICNFYYCIQYLYSKYHSKSLPWIVCRGWLSGGLHAGWFESDCGGRHSHWASQPPTILPSITVFRWHSSPLLSSLTSPFSPILDYYHMRSKAHILLGNLCHWAIYVCMHIYEYILCIYIVYIYICNVCVDCRCIYNVKGLDKLCHLTMHVRRRILGGEGKTVL